MESHWSFCQCSCCNLENFFRCSGLFFMTYVLLWLPWVFAKLHSFIPLLLVKRNVDLSWCVWVVGRGLGKLVFIGCCRGVCLGGAIFVPLQFLVHCCWLFSSSFCLPPCCFSRTSGECPVHSVVAAKQDLGWGWFSLFSEKILWREKSCKSTKKKKSKISRSFS